VLDTRNGIKYNQERKYRGKEDIEMILPFFQLSLAIRNVWPQRMSMKAFIALYMLLLFAGMPVTLLSCIPYGLFAIPTAVCIYGLITCRDTAAQNVCMGMIGFILTIVTVNLLTNILNLLTPLSSISQQYISFGVNLIYTFLFYLITFFFGRLLKKLLLSGKGVLRFQHTWYLIDAASLLLITIYLFDDLIPGQNGSVGKMIYNNVLHILGYLLELKQFFETNIFPTKNLIDQGDYKLNQLGNISVLEIKSLLSVKLIYAHESGIDVTIDIPDRVDDFPMDTVDLARILGIFLDNAIEAASAAEQPQIGLNIIQHDASVSIIISNCFQDNGAALHELKQSGFSTKTGHQGIGLSNAQKIINSYDNVLLETTMQHGYFMQHMELAGGKE